MKLLHLPGSLTALRWTTAGLFMAHAIVRIANGSIAQFAAFLAQRGFPLATALVWLITVTEIVSGTLLICGRYIPWAAAALAFIAWMGIVIVHAPIGWFVGEHGTGGMEYSVLLLASLWVIAAASRRRSSTSSRSEENPDA